MNLKIIIQELENISDKELEILINLLEQECEWYSINIIFQRLKDIQCERYTCLKPQIKKENKNA